MWFVYVIDGLQVLVFGIIQEVEKKPDVSEKVAKMLKPSPSLYNDYYYTKKYYNRLPQIHKKVGIGEFTFSLMEKKTRTNTLRPKVSDNTLIQQYWNSCLNKTPLRNK